VLSRATGPMGGEGGHSPESSSLFHSVWAQQPVNFTFLHHYVHAGEGGHGAEALDQVAYLDGGHHGLKFHRGA